VQIGIASPGITPPPAPQPAPKRAAEEREEVGSFGD